MTVIHVLPKRFEDFLRHLGCNSPRPSIVRSLPFTALARHGGNHKLVVFSRGNRNPVHVGYQSAKLQQYGLTVGACFVPVTGSTFDLTDLKVTGYESETEGDVQIQTLDEFGRTVANFTYYDIPGQLTGWFDSGDNEVEPEVVTFQAGEGLWSYSLDNGFGLQSAGMVPTTPVTVTLQQYGLSVANPTPVNVDLTQITVGGYEGSSEGDVQVQTLDEFGRTVANFTYYDIPGQLTGWFDSGDNEVAVGDVVVKPGEGLWTYSLNDGFSFIFPGVTL